MFPECLKCSRLGIKSAPAAASMKQAILNYKKAARKSGDTIMRTTHTIASRSHAVSLYR